MRSSFRNEHLAIIVYRYYIIHDWIAFVFLRGVCFEIFGQNIWKPEWIKTNTSDRRCSMSLIVVSKLLKLYKIFTTRLVKNILLREENYFPNGKLPDYQFFCPLWNDLNGIIFRNNAELRSSKIDFNEEKSEFFERRFEKLPEHWEKIANNHGKYSMFLNIFLVNNNSLSVWNCTNLLDKPDTNSFDIRANRSY